MNTYEGKNVIGPQENHSDLPCLSVSEFCFRQPYLEALASTCITLKLTGFSKSFFAR